MRGSVETLFGRGHVKEVYATKVRAESATSLFGPATDHDGLLVRTSTFNLLKSRTGTEAANISELAFASKLFKILLYGRDTADACGIREIVFSRYQGF